MSTACTVCGCHSPHARWHQLSAAIAAGDLDAALSAGLLEAQPCARCSDTCRDAVLAHQQARLQALAARDRFRQRQARLRRNDAERAARRAEAGRQVSALPPAAAAALARAKARVSGG